MQIKVIFIPMVEIKGVLCCCCFFFQGYYAYIETSSPRKQGDDAKLVYRPNLGNRESCISFYYHMKGKGIGELNVKVNGKIIFKKNGQQGVDWKKAQIKVKETARIVSEPAIYHN